MNENSNNKVFIDDPVWRKWGVVQRSVRATDVWLNLIQGAETAKRISSLNIVVNGRKIKGKIYFNLGNFDKPKAPNYDVRQAMNAMYSHPNDYTKNLKIAKAGITDMELTNIVRNKQWFDLTTFFKIENGQMKTLTKMEVEREFGIKYIGDLVNK